MGIIAYDNQRSDVDTIHPSSPFVFCLSGQIASGKSTLLLNLLLDKKFYYQKYNRIIFMSPTLELDEKVNKIVSDKTICVSNQKLIDAIEDELDSIQEEPIERTKLDPFHAIEKEDLYEVYDKQIILDLKKHQKNVIKNYGKDLADSVLICVEDAPAMGLLRQGHSNIFARFCTELRHYKTDILICTQLFKTIPKIIRHQLTAACFFDTNEKEQEDIYETFSCNMPRRKWEEYFNILTHKRYSFIHFNLKNNKGRKIVRNFDEFV